MKSLRNKRNFLFSATKFIGKLCRMIILLGKFFGNFCLTAKKDSIRRSHKHWEERKKVRIVVMIHVGYVCGLGHR